MADITVTPVALELALTQQAITLPGVDHTSTVSTLALVLTLPISEVVISFPGLSRKPSHAFSDELDARAVLVGSTASGYPVLNKQFTFDPRTFTPELRNLSKADKLTVMAFYEQNKDKVFPWYNKQDDATYEVCFAEKPKCRIDGRIDLWKINIVFLQSTP